MSIFTNKTLLLFLCTLFALQTTILSANEDDYFSFSCSGNVIDDGDLESSDLKKKNWQFQGNTWRTTSNVNTGSKAIGMNNNDGTAGIYQKKSASAGQTYSLSVFAKSSTGYGDVGFRFLNSSNGILHDYKLDVDQSSNFKEYTLSGTAPAGTAYVQVFGIIYSGGTFYVDSYCLQHWTVPSPPSCSTSCDNENDFDDPVLFIDPSGNGNAWLGYTNSNLEVCNNGDGTYNIQGSVIGGHDAVGWGGTGVPCGSQDGYSVNLLLSDRQTWNEFQGNYEENAAAPNHTDWDYYQVTGTFTGLGCNSGTTVNVTSAAMGYRMQVGYGANSHFPNEFGFATWFSANINGSSVGSDLYGVFDDSCYEVCSNITNGGTVGVDQSACGSSYDPETIQNVSLPTGGSGTIKYKWLKSTTTCSAPSGINDSNWSVISGADNASYNPGVITETTCYVRFSKRSGCSDYVKKSNVVTVELHTELPTLTAGNNGPLSSSTPTVTLSANSDASSPTWSWDGPNGFTSSSQNPTTTVVGTYNVTVTDEDSGCSNTASTLVTTEAVPPPNETCDGSNFTWSSNITVNGGNVSGDLLMRSSNTLYLIPTNTYPSEFASQVFISIPEAVSFDGYNNRENSGVQAYERWKVVFVKDNNVVHETGYTEDIEDGVASDDWVGSLMGDVFFPDGVDEIYIVHYEDDTYGNGAQATSNSVRPSTLCFDFTACDVTITAETDGPITSQNTEVQLSATSNASSPTWSWTGPSGFISSLQNPTTTVIGTYTVTVTDGVTGCSNSATTEVTTEITPPTAESCDNDNFTWTSNIVVNGNSVSGDVLLTSYNTSFLIPTNTYPAEFSDPIYISIPEAIAFDGYSNRINSGIQAYERWKVVFVKNDVVVEESDYTLDLADGVESAEFVGDIMEEVFLPNGVDEIYIVHYEDDEFGEGAQDSPNSVRPSSICFDYVACDVNITASNDGPITSANPEVQLSATTNASNPSWSWTGPNGFTSNLQNPTTTIVGTYTVTVTDGVTGCSNSTTTEVTTQILPPTAESCDNDNFTWTSNIQVNGNTVTGDLRLKSGETSFLIPTNTYPAEFSNSVFISIPEAISYDGYNNRRNATAQPYEQWKVVFKKNGVVVHSTGYTEDIADGVESDDWVGSLMGEVFFPNGVDEIYIIQYEDAEYGNGEQPTPNSVRPSSICFDYEECDVVASASADPSSICSGSSTTLTASGTGGDEDYSYAWDNGAGSSASVDVSPSSTTTYTVTVTDGNGCADTDEVVVTVNDKPTVSLDEAGPLCEDADAVQLNGSPSGGTYSGTGVDANGLFDPSVSGDGTFTINYEYETGEGCSAAASIEIVVNELPTVSAVASPDPVCYGEAVTLTASGSGGSGNYTYEWSDGLGTGNEVTASNITSNATYSVTLTDDSGCTAETTVDVTVSQVIASASDDVEICEDASTTISVSATGGDEDYSYAWDNGAGSSASVDVSPSSTTTYTVTVTDGNGCADTDEVVVTVNDEPTVSLDGAGPLCEDADAVQLNGSPSGGTYSGTGVDANGLFDPSVSGDGTFTINYEYETGEGCSAAASIEIVVNDLPTVSAVASPDPVCEGEEVTLTATASGGSGSFDYEWSDGLGSGNTVTVNGIQNSKTYTVTATDENGCTDEAEVTVNVDEKATVGDFVFVDKNFNGIQEAGDDGIDGVSVDLYTSGGTFVASTTSANGGAYSFEVCAGDYYIVFGDLTDNVRSPEGQGADDKDSDANETTGRTDDFTLNPGDDNQDIDAGYSELASLGDFVFMDFDGDGIQDSGDIPVANVTVNLKDEDGNVIGTTTTNGLGKYEFVDLTPGKYSVQFVLPSNRSFSPLNEGGDESKDSDADPAMNGMTELVTLESGDEYEDLDAGIYEDASIGDLVFLDTDGDGIQDPGEEGVEGITVNLKDENGNVVATTTTDEDGAYLFDGLAPGEYSVQFVLPDGSTFSPLNEGGDESKDSDADPAMEGMTETITLQSGEDNEDLDAGIIEPASIGDLVFLDANANGIQDPGEDGIEGVTVSLTDANGNPVKDASGNDVTSITTGNAGDYEFTNLLPGDYIVVFGTPSGFEPSPADEGGDDTKDSDAVGGSSPVTNLESGEDDDTVDAGFYEDASIGDLVFLDKDADGIQDPGEEGVEGITVNLKDEDGNVIATTTTDEDGAYLFDGLTPGEYSVQFVLPDGSTFSPLNEGGDESKDSDADPAMDGMTENVTLESGEDNEDLDAGIYEDASIGDLVFLDEDGDGIQDPGEEGVEGITVNLKDEDGNVVATTSTDEDGAYLFDGLAPGEYSVQFVLPDGSTFSPLNEGGDESKDSDADPAMDGMTENVTLESGDEYEDLDAGIYEEASIGDLVFLDEDGDGIQDPGEEGVEGITVNLKDEDGNVIATTTTDEDGAYLFDGLAPGEYSVQFVLPDGSTFSPLNEGGDEAKDSDADPAMDGMTESVTLESGDENEDLDAGIFEPASVGDYVFNDVNNDGIQNAGDTPLEGVTIKLTDADGNDVVDADGNIVNPIESESDGSYLFDNLLPGDYIVVFDTPDNFDPTKQDEGGNVGDEGDSNDDSDINSEGESYVVTLTSGENEEDVDAGFSSIADLNLVKGVSSPTAVVGSEVTFTIEVENEGPHNATGVSIGDAVPNGFGNISSVSNGGEISGNEILWTDLTVAASSSIEVTFTAEVLAPGNGVSHVNIAKIETSDQFDPDSTPGNEADTNPGGGIGSEDDDDTQDPNDEDDGDDAVVTPISPSVSIEKYTNGEDADFAPGVVVPFPNGTEAEIEWTYNVTNDGDVDLVDVIVTDNVEGYICTIPSLLKGETKTCSKSGIAMSGQYTNIGSVVGTPVDPSTGDPLEDNKVEDEDPSNYRGIRFNIESTVTPENICPGETVDIKVAIRLYPDVDMNGEELPVDPSLQLRNISFTSEALGITLTTADTDPYFDDSNDLNGDGNLGQDEYEFFWNYSVVANGTNTYEVMDVFDIYLGEVNLATSGTTDTWTVTSDPANCASLGDYVWFDENADGIQDPNEDGVNGITVNLYNGEGDLISTTTTVNNPATANDGFYEFTGLLADDYVLEFVDSSDEYTFSPANIGETGGVDVADDSDADPNTGKTAPIALAKGENNPNIDAGIFMAASIGDYVWNDANGNGIQDNGENGIEDAVVLLTNSLGLPVLDIFGMPVLPQMTGSEGEYSFDNLPPGNYQVTFVNPEGLLLTLTDVGQGGEDVANDSDADPITGMSHVIELESGEQNNDVDAGYFNPSSIGDYVWNDEDGDGVQDNDEDGVDEITVNLYTDEDMDGMIEPGQEPIQTTETDEDGYYIFDGLPSGKYLVEFVTEDYIVSPQDQGGNDENDSDINPDSGLSPSITLGEGEDNMTIDAGVYIGGGLGDLVWVENSSNNPDSYDVGVDIPKEDVVVNLFKQNDEGVFVQVATTETNENGEYFFDNLSKGVYQVEFINPGEGLVFVSQNVGNEDVDSDPNTEGLTNQILLGAGEVNVDVDAGFTLAPVPVELVSFTGKWNEDRDVNELTWETSSEVNNDYFEIERSYSNTGNFSTVAKVLGNGTTFESQYYDLVDRNIDENGIYFYRLKQYDYDGTYAYSDIIAIRVEREIDTNISVYPNPTIDYLNIEITSAKQEDITIQLFDMSGKLIKTQGVKAGDVQYDNRISIQVGDLPSGIYNVITTVGTKIFNDKINVLD